MRPKVTVRRSRKRDDAMLRIERDYWRRLALIYHELVDAAPPGSMARVWEEENAELRNALLVCRRYLLEDANGETSQADYYEALNATLIAESQR